MDKLPLNSLALQELQQRVADYEDEVSYKKLFFHFFLPLKSFSFSIIRSKELAEEIVSDILIEIWAKRKQLTEIEDLKMYLYVSVRNASLRKWKQTRKSLLLSLDDVNVEFASSYENGETILLTQELSEKIDTAVQQLPQRCKLIFKLAKEDRLKYKEIALLLNISVKTIDHQVSIAIKKIAEVLHISLRKPMRQ
ncbi:MAG: sigma-70 family RNA polymerase sigma factor [Ferruginibacter sp.]|nr:sigma-70 family RNA polymerase sigma factor [Ferruginibacter sp.]